MYNKKTIRVLLTLFSVSCLIQDGVGQIGIGTLTPDNSSIVEISSTEKGFLPPRMANPSSITSPATGLLIYNTTDNCLQVNTGTPASPVWT
jgi:hypothetical protein